MLSDVSQHLLQAQTPFYFLDKALAVGSSVPFADPNASSVNAIP
jgi:hypothetical protein